MICVEWALLGEKIAVIAGRFVAMMAIGDEEGFGIEDRGNLGDCFDVGHGPEAMDDAEMIRRGQRRLSGDGGFEQVLSSVVWVWVEAEDQAEVGAAGFREIQSVLLGTRMGLFVRVD